MTATNLASLDANGLRKEVAYQARFAAAAARDMAASVADSAAVDGFFFGGPTEAEHFAEVSEKGLEACRALDAATADECWAQALEAAKADLAARDAAR